MAALLLALTAACTLPTEANPMTATPPSPRVQKLFEQTKPVCFGRFVMDVPAETQVVPGPQSFGPTIESRSGAAKDIPKLVAAKRSELQKIKHGIEEGSLLREVRDGPTIGSAIVLFRQHEAATRVMEVWSYLSAPPHAFLHKDNSANKSLEETLERSTYIATNLRARAPDEIPAEPGVCLDLGFIRDDSGSFQEIFGIGLRFPSLPDVSFSVSSNKDGVTEPGLSEQRKRAERAILGTPMEADFRKVKVLREGKRSVAQWAGEEALFRRPTEAGAHHEFQFDFPGIRYDRHNPNIDAVLYTGVKDNRAGALPASLADEEALALWDRLLGSLRLRVAPGR